MSFVLLVVLNTVLFIRPSELVPALATVPLYQIAILACLAVSFPVVLAQLSTENLVAQPISACVIGLMAIGIVSGLGRGRFVEAWDAFDMFYKVVLYYLLIVGLVNSRDRMRWLLRMMVLCSVVVTGIAVLNHQGLIHVATVKTTLEYRYVNGEEVAIHRLGGTGLFGDPNDLCTLLAQNMILCAYLITDRGSNLLVRAFWIAPMALLGHAMVLTDSRGGLLALLGGIAVYLVARFGRRSLPLGAVALPVVLVLLAGRRSSVDFEGGSGQQRIQLWNEHLQLFRHHPLFGVGANNAADLVTQVAHNSFINFYSELGFGGGVLFLGAFCLALWEIKRLGDHRVTILDPETARMRPYLTAALACYMIGMMSLTRGYLAPTYFILGVVVAYLRIAQTDPPLTPTRLDGRLVMYSILLGCVFFVAMTLFVQFKVRYR